MIGSKYTIKETIIPYLWMISLWKIFTLFKNSFKILEKTTNMYPFRNLKKQDLKKENMTNPLGKIAFVCRNQSSYSKLHQDNNSELAFGRTAAMTTLLQIYRNSPRPHPLAGLRNVPYPSSHVGNIIRLYPEL